MKPTVEFGLGMLIGTVVGTGLAILFAPVPATTTRWLLLSPDLDERHQAGARIPHRIRWLSVPPPALLTGDRQRSTSPHATPSRLLLSAGNTA